MNIKFVDLFSGIGGFHQAVKKLDKNSDLIFACDIDEKASKVYEKSYGYNSLGDIKNPEVLNRLEKSVKTKSGFNLLCAGFPCQSFSHAGKQAGFADETKGTLFFSIKEILKKYKPKYFILENVKNIVSHDNKRTWQTIKKNLEKDYVINLEIVSPHNIGIPALRPRAFILGILKEEINDLSKFHFSSWDDYIRNRNFRQYSLIVNDQLSKKYFLDIANEDLLLSKYRTDIINMWSDLRKKIKVLISPIWFEYLIDDLHTSDYDVSPEWKKKIIKRNHDFYRANKKKIADWKKSHINLISKLNKSDLKFEWNANSSINDIWDGIIQFRPSGVRVKKPDYIPTIVAINHKPIIQGRYISPIEIAKLYGFNLQKLKLDLDNLSQSYRQLGNTVSVDVVYELIRYLFLNGGDNE